MGSQTRQVLGAVSGGAGSAAQARAAARELHRATGQSAGNGSLMRTAPVALAYLGDPGGLAEAATALSGLTHYDPEAGEACVLWCLAIRHAVLSGEADAAAGLAGLPAARRDVWAARLAAAEQGRPRDFDRNGWVVHALQGAWSAIAAASARDRRVSCGGRWRRRCGAAGIPTRWRPSRAGWPARPAVPPRYRSRGGRRCTGGPDCARPGWPS